VLYPLMRWLKGGGRRVLAGVNSFLARPGVIYLLALPTVMLIAFADPNNPVMAEKEGGWSLVIYLWLLFTGFIVVSAPELETSIKRLRWLSLGMAAILTIIFLSVVVVTQRVLTFGTSLYTFAFGIAGFSSWCWILAYFGLSMKYLNFRKPVLEYANEAVLPFYILHQTVLICVGYFVVQWPIPDLLRWAAILLISFAVIMTLYEFIIRRFNVMRVLFGMKSTAKQPIQRTSDALATH